MKIEARYGTPLPELVLSGDGLELRPFSLGDLPLIEEASADPHITTITAVPVVFSPSQGERFIKRQIQQRLSGDGWSLAIVEEATQRTIGQVGLSIASIGRGRADLSYWVVQSGRGHAAAGRALRLLSEWAVEHLDVSRLSLFIESANTASVRTAEHAGYVQEGLLANWERVGGVAKDMYLFALVAPTRTHGTDSSTVPRPPS